jgi:iron complex outermembrane receptor protein
MARRAARHERRNAACWQAAQETAAQDDQAPNGETVVTAQKRSENAQNVGIAITAYSGDQLRALGTQRSGRHRPSRRAFRFRAASAGQNAQFRTVPRRRPERLQRHRWKHQRGLPR